MRFVFSFILSISIASTVFGAACDILRESFSDQSCYSTGQCGFNVAKLLGRFEAAGEHIPNYDVVFVMHQLRVIAGGPTMATALPVTHMRDFASLRSFATHFFILEKSTGKVFDLDFIPEPTPVGEYAQRMFAQSPPKDVVVKRIGAHQYLEMLRERNVQSNDEVGLLVRELKEETPQWPEARLNDIIDSYQ